MLSAAHGAAARHHDMDSMFTDGIVRAGGQSSDSRMPYSESG